MSDSKFTLGKEERLKSRKLIEGLFREGKSFALFPFRVWYVLRAAEEASGSLPAGERSGAGLGSPVAGGFLQAGFGASSRNFKKAVDRNRIKRLIREAYRLQKNALQDRLEEKNRSLALFFIYTGKELPDHQTVTVKIGLILQKLEKETVKETGG